MKFDCTRKAYNFFEVKYCSIQGNRYPPSIFEIRDKICIRLLQHALARHSGNELNISILINWLNVLELINSFQYFD